MTERLYYIDAGLLQFEGRIVECGEAEGQHYTVLDKSAFYPTSGGQLHDTGSLNGVRVVDVIEHDDDTVRHLTAQPVGSVGDNAKGMVDGDRRRQFRQQHTAQHILSQVLVRLFDLVTDSVHLGEEYAAVELAADGVSQAQLAEAEREANHIVARNLPVEILFVDRQEAARLPLRKIPEREGKFRIIRVGEFDYSACGGTHCNSSAEVRLVKITGTEKMRGKVLVKFLSGDAAVDDYAARFGITDELSRNFTCHFQDLPDKIAGLDSANRAMRKDITALQKELMPIKAQALAESSVIQSGYHMVARDIGEYDAKLAGSLAAAVAERVEGVALLQTGSRLILAVSEKCELHAGEMVKRFGAAAGLKGGGSRTTAQVGGAETGKLEHYRQLLVQTLNDG